MAVRLKPDATPILQAQAAFYLAPRGFLDEAERIMLDAVESDAQSLA